MSISRRYCPRCKSSGPASGGANHILHLLISLATLGFWVPMWMACAWFPAYHCHRCGSQTGIPVKFLWIAGGVIVVLGLILEMGKNDPPKRVAREPLRQGESWRE